MRKFALIVIDVVLTFLAGVFALFTRFGFDFVEMKKFAPSVLVYGIVSIVVYILNGNHRAVWAYASPKDMMNIFRGTLLSYLSTLLVLHIWRGVVLPRSVGIMTFLGSTVLIIMSRIFWQWYVHYKTGRGEKRVAIIGAGDAGVTLLEEFERRPHLGKVVAFLDDSKRKTGRKIRGVPVYGPISRVMDVVEALNIDELIIAIPSAKKEEMKRILGYIDLKKVRVKTLPGIYELTDTKVKVSHLREISIEDILGREEIRVNLEEIGSYIKNKVVLVTGAGGSIGSELTKQISRLSPKEIVILGKGENSIYQTNGMLSVEFPSIKKKSVIGDVADKVWMEEVIKEVGPDIIFHAAAHKHVDLMEKNPYEAFRVNTLGTKNLVELSCKYGVERFIFISTDKAVNPTSIMGLSKRLGELYILYCVKNCDTKFAVVRFGNVLGSRGSVIPKFEKQIKMGGPVTVTDPRMKRFFMSIPEAVSLVLQAGAYTKGNDLFVLDMGEQISIDELARTLITLHGLIPDQDIKIVYTGIRPGEKLYEELFYPYERPLETNHKKVFRVVSEKSFENVCGLMDEIEKLIVENQINVLLEKVKEVIPEYSGRWKDVDGDK